METAKRLAEFTQNENWVYNRRNDLRSKFPDQFVVVFNGGVQFNAGTMDAISQYLDTQEEAIQLTAAVEFVAERASCMLL